MSEIAPAIPAARAPGGALALPGLHRFVVIASPESAAWALAFESPLGVLVLDPLRAPDADAIGPLQPPNYGPPETAIPRWAVYDCAEVPGAVIGLLRTPIGSPFDRPLDPLALVLATAHAEPGSWHLYSLTVRTTSPAVDVRALRLRTIGSAMELLGAERATLVVPWSAPMLDGLPELGAVEVLAAITPLHGPVPAATLMISRGGAPSARAGALPAFHITSEARGLASTLDRLQAALEEGRRFVLVPPGPGAPGVPQGTRLVACEVDG